MASTISSDYDDDVVITIASTPAASAEGGGGDVYDLRPVANDDGSSSASTRYHGATILPSVAPSSAATHRSIADDRRADGGGTTAVTVHIASSLSLSVNPSMIDSSVFEPPAGNGDGDANDIENWIGLHLHRSSVSRSSGTISSGESTPCYAPNVFANIGRSLVLASASLDGASSVSDLALSDASSAADLALISDVASLAPSDVSGITEADSDPHSSGAASAAPSGKVNWWERLRTDEDWANFREKAKDYLNALVVEEMRDGKRRRGNERNNGNEDVIDETSAADGAAGVGQWLRRLYEALAATAVAAGIISERNYSARAEYYSSLVGEAAEIRRELEALPPAPPALPEGIPLDGLPRESREALLRYRDDLDVWRGEAMPRREELEGRYSRCQERLLAAIIDSEEGAFYEHGGEDDGSLDLGSLGADEDDGGGERGVFKGAVDDDGYVHVVEGKSPLWDEASEALIVPQARCQLNLRAAVVAALTAGASFFLTMQSKRRY